MSLSSSAVSASSSFSPYPSIRFLGSAVRDPVTWQPVGPLEIPNATGGANALASGKMQAFALDPSDSQIMFVGGGEGPGNSGPTGESGVWGTIDGGRNWVALDHGLTNPIVDALWLDPSNPSTLLAGTWYDGSTNAGIFRSTDAGSNWTLVYPYVTTDFLQVGTTVWAATDAGIATSTDHGATWSLTDSTTNPVRVIAGVSGLIYAGLDNGTILVNQSGVAGWRMTNPTSGTTVWSIAVDPTDSSHVIVVEWRGYQTPDLYVSDNAGMTWATLSSYSGPAQYAAFNESTPKGTVPVLYVGEDGSLSISVDNGSSFSNLPLSVDVRFIDPLPNGAVIVGSDQGLYLGSGSQWKGLSASIPASLLTGFAASGSTIVTAVQDFSPILSFDGGGSWTQLEQPSPAVGEDGVTAISPLNPSQVYFFTTGGFQYSSDGGHTFHTTVTPLKYAFQGTEQLIAFDPNASLHLLVAAQNGIYTSWDGGQSFTLEPWGFGQPTVVVVDPQDNQTIYVGNGFELYVSHDGGGNWTTCGLASSSPILSVAIDPVNPSVLLVATGSGPTSLYRTEDGCASFVNANKGLPAFSTKLGPSLQDIAFQPDGGVVALATDDGVYVSQDTGTDWVDISGNIIPLMATGVAWSGANLYASTYGEGVLRVPIETVAPQLYSVTFTETGLPSGTSWQVWLNSTDGGSDYHASGTTANLTLQAANGSYAYAVTTANKGYYAHPATGLTASVNGVPVTESVTFSAFTYTVTFTETGLPSGTSRTVTLNGVPQSSPGSTLTFMEPNGSYTYSIADIAGWHQTTLPYTGTVMVSGASVSVPTLVFTQVTYAVTFTESGLSSGTSWTVTLAGASQSSGGMTITFQEPNGTYAFSVGPVSGYTSNPSAGSLSVSGAPVSQTLTFPASGSGSVSGFLGLSGNTGYFVLGGVAILVVAGAAVALVLRARRK